jgi:Intracellular proteinase inhibitor
MKRRTHLNLEPLEGRALLSGLAYSLTTNQTVYQPGQPVVMTFRETNVSNHTISVDSGPSIDGFDVKQGGTLIWRSNAGINPMFILLDPLQPGQSLTLTATWNGVPTGGSTPVSGTFEITNQLNSSTSATVTITTATPTPAPTPAPTPPPPGGVTNPTPTPLPITMPVAGQNPMSQDPTSDPPATPVSSPSPIALSVSTDHPTYRKGHKVRMTMTLQNVSDSTVNLPIVSVQQFTVLEGSTPVWHWGRAISGVGSLSLKPGQSVSFTADWNGKAHQAGVSIAAGTYTIEASDGNYSGSTSFRVNS